jgi:hypothetical protein
MFNIIPAPLASVSQLDLPIMVFFIRDWTALGVRKDEKEVVVLGHVGYETDGLRAAKPHTDRFIALQ